MIGYHDLVDKVLICQRLDLILEVFPNLNGDSLIYPWTEKQHSRANVTCLAMVLHLLWCQIRHFLQLEESQRLYASMCTSLPFLKFLLSSKGTAFIAAFLPAEARIYFFLLSLLFFFFLVSLYLKEFTWYLMEVVQLICKLLEERMTTCAEVHMAGMGLSLLCAHMHFLKWKWGYKHFLFYQ